MFEAKRIFSQRNVETQATEWFFQAREGIIGPYESERVAEKGLEGFVAHCRQRGLDGGRGGRKQVGLALEPLEPFTIKEFDPARRKKGLDSLN